MTLQNQIDHVRAIDHQIRCGDVKTIYSMSIPPRPDVDSDFAVAAVVNAAKSTLRTCAWYDPGDSDGMFETQCGNAFNFNDGGPKDNGFIYCPYCGGKIDHD